MAASGKLTGDRLVLAVDPADKEKGDYNAAWVRATSEERMKALYDSMGGRAKVAADVKARQRSRLDAIFEASYKRYHEATP